MPQIRTITREELRRIVIVRQHLDASSRPDMLGVIRDIGCLQLDPISAVQRSHLLVLFSRLGNYDPSQLDTLLWQDRTLFEYWAHAASIVLTEEYPVHAWRMAHHRHNIPWIKNPDRWINSEIGQYEQLKQSLLEHFRVHGSCLSREFADKSTGAGWSSGWTSDRNVNRMLDYLWDAGEVMVVGRKNNHRLWGLSDDFLPDWTIRQPLDDDQVTRFAVQKALMALGAGTSKHIKLHYTRHRYPHLEHILKSLVNENILEHVEITENRAILPGNWYMPTALIPLLEQIRAGDWQPRTTLLSPFDNLICDRDRTEMLFDFFYRIEIYVPANKRQYGYYVLPILHEDRLIGRINPFMDRKTGTLHIYDVYAELSAPQNSESIEAIASAIHNLAEFLGASSIEWGRVPTIWSNLTKKD